jgi:MFS family permease
VSLPHVGTLMGMGLINRYYITSVLQINVGLDRNLALLLGGVINTMFIIGSLFPTFFLDRVGRRRPMMWGSLGLGVCMMMIAILLSFADAEEGLRKRTSSTSVAFFFLVSFPAKHDASTTDITVHVDIWGYSQLYPLGIRAGDPAFASQGEGHGSGCVE